MKKISLLMVLFFLVVNVSTAQVLVGILFGDKLNTDELRFGINAGFNVATIKNYPGASSGSEGFIVGSFFDYKINQQWRAHLELTGYSKFSTEIPVYTLNDPQLDNLLEDADVSRELSYIGLQPSIRRMILEKSTLFAEAGMQFSLLVDAKDFFTSDRLTYREPIFSSLNKIDIGWNAGVGYTFKQGDGITIAARYYRGFTNIDEDWKNSSFQFLAQIPLRGLN